MSTVQNYNGKEINYEAACELMDDDIRELLHRIKAPCTKQEFYDAYCELHERYYGSPFIV